MARVTGYLGGAFVDSSLWMMCDAASSCEIEFNCQQPFLLHVSTKAPTRLTLKTCHVLIATDLVQMLILKTLGHVSTARTLASLPTIPLPP